MRCRSCKEMDADCSCRVCGVTRWCQECAWLEQGCVRLPLRVQHEDPEAPVWCVACAMLAEASGDTLYRECQRVRALRDELAAWWNRFYVRRDAAEKAAHEALARTLTRD